MFTIHFQGYFQCRLATDPDPTNHARGQNGWTFAYDGEPDLDRIIRFQNPVAPRLLAPAVGVRVVDVGGDAHHALVGAQIQLLEDAKFEGRNGLIAQAGKEPVAPFVLQIQKGSFKLVRRDDYVVTDAPARQPHLGHGVTSLSPTDQTSLGLQNPVAFRLARKQALQAALLVETDAVKKSNLSQRIDQLENFNAASDVQVFALKFKVPYAHPLRHAATLTDPDHVLPGVNVAVPWDIAYWMGAWDADALQGYVDGTVQVATVA